MQGSCVEKCRQPYLCNGIFTSLKEVAYFCNTRDTRNDWGKPEVLENVNTEELDDPGLSDKEVGAIVAIMRSLTGE
jgi:cytochrome c peroxidase